MDPALLQPSLRTLPDVKPDPSSLEGNAANSTSPTAAAPTAPAELAGSSTLTQASTSSEANADGSQPQSQSQPHSQPQPQPQQPPAANNNGESDSHDEDAHMTSGAGNDDDEAGGDGDGDGEGGAENAKRPRLRLAHACDRCRRRKIRCDTQHPCTPCQQSNNNCTFETPSRRTVKPKATAGERVGSSSGVKRPHSPNRASAAGIASGLKIGGGPGTLAGLAAGVGANGESQANLEARLAALESMLRDVPPNVHNAFLSTLDARLGSGTGIGIQEGVAGREGVGVSVEALAGSHTLGSLTGLDNSNSWGFPSSTLASTSNANANTGLNSYSSTLGGSSTLAPDWTATSLSAWLGGAQGLTRKREEEGMSELAKRMEGMSFFYEDEIGQAKWQGATSGFPLLDLLTAANVRKDENDSNNEQPTNNFSSPANDSTKSTSPAITTATPRRSSVAPSARSLNAARSSSASAAKGRSSSVGAPRAGTAASPDDTKVKSRFFPDRTPRPHQTLNPEASWKVITGVIPPDLMDTLVRCYLSTSHLLWPFLHVPSFLADYANPAQWGEPGFTCFIVAVCTLSSRHVDDPRVRANPSDPSTAGKQYFELFKRLRDLPSADRPTLYSIQAAFLAAIYAFGLGNLSKAFALQAESITLCLDGGLHRSVDGYDHFNAVERETRKRTFWSIYAWDKQSAALFGRPPIIHLRDCDVTEPLVVDDENLTVEGVQETASDTQSRMCAFVAAIRLHVILEGVIDSATQPSSFPTSPFLAKAAATIARRSQQNESLRDEESLLEEWTKLLPKYWHYDTDTANSRDPIRITQAERLHCLEHLVKMIIYRHRFSGFVAMPASTAEERSRHLDLCRKAMQCALTIIADHVHISQRGMMTYYGVHVIHQLAQAGRTLVAVILNCRDADFRPIIAPSIEGLRSCVGLLRRFSGRYLCGLRSADIIDEFCRICNIPVDSPRVPDGSDRPAPAWLRPVRRRVSPSPGPDAGASGRADSISPGAMMDFNMPNLSASLSADPSTGLGVSDSIGQSDLDALFNTSAYFDISAMDNTAALPTNTNSNNTNAATNNGYGATSTNPTPTVNYPNNSTTSGGDLGAFLSTLGEASAPYDRLETLTPNYDLGSGSVMLSGAGGGYNGNGGFNQTLSQGQGGFGQASASGSALASGTGSSQSQNQGQAQTLSFDYLNGGGFGGETLAGEGMDSVSDGLKQGGGGLSAATILSLMEEGSFDYGSIFTDQAPLPMEY